MGAALGGNDEEKVKPNVVEPVINQELTDPIVDESEIVVTIPVTEEKKLYTTGKVGLLLSGSIALEEIETAVVSALLREGVSGVVVARVGELSALPYAVQSVAEDFSVIVAAGVVTHDPLGVLTQSVTTSLLGLGTGGSGIKVVPALVIFSSLLEVKALIKKVSKLWAKSVASVLALEQAKPVFKQVVEPVLEKEVVFSPQLESTEDLLVVLRESLKEHGARGIIGLARKFRIVDDNGNGQLDIEEFSKMTKEHTLLWTPHQIKAVFDFFDSDKSGSISFDEFLSAIRGQLNDRRYQFVLLAFEKLDSDKSGSIDIKEISAKFNAHKHPDVISGHRTEEDVLEEFLETFDGDNNKDGKVTLQSFAKYYSNVSSSIDDDDYFELMMRNAWHISGGEGWCANSTCRRVLVTHKDGHQTVEEIKDDLGVSADDKDVMLANLVKQGISDVVDFSWSGSVSSSVSEPVSTPVVSVPAPVVPTSVETAKAGFKQQTAEHVPPTKHRSVNNPRRDPGGASSIIFG